MKNQLAKQIESLVKEFNAKNEKHNNVYEMKVIPFGRGEKAIHIDYTLFFSTDMKVLMSFVCHNHLIMMLGTYNGNGAYIDIQ